MNKKAGGCSSGKVRYRDRVSALLARANIGRTDSSHRPKSERRAYWCPQCRGWHLTSEPRRRTKPAIT